MLIRNDYLRHNSKTLKLVLAALFLAFAYVMPFLTGQIPEIGAMLCPMHLPIILCGFICGWQYGGAVGLSAVASVLVSVLTFRRMKKHVFQHRTD